VPTRAQWLRRHWLQQLFHILRCCLLLT